MSVYVSLFLSLLSPLSLLSLFLSLPLFMLLLVPVLYEFYRIVGINQFKRTQLKNLQEVCSKDFGTKSRKVHKKFSKYGVKILKVFKKLPNSLSLLSSSSSSSSVAAVSNGSKQKVQRSNLDGVLWLASPPSCSCKKLKRGMMYLLIGRSSERPNERYEMKRNNRNKPTIILDQESKAVKWSVDVEKKLRKLITRETGKSGNRC
ncbi:hypothetical protein HELRODRAFT_190511 [Helobdella robusta]|uniref:NTR domain-containing protein n=1 Tax=Helobdella robusta TaxID=6412 RepID=T1FS23_HELRO|nr:hypothetical protein HELRODRAFT_190511 [Helobdella robusta]ESO09473.1 hypothetical protein HELRODRAFT_190511 [Helobdella robusta]